MNEFEAQGAESPRRPARAVFLLPALLTLGNIFLGFFAIVKAIDGRFTAAATCLVFAAVLDKFDGLVARKTGTDSDFGKELDSLADVISFGMAPALLAFTWGLGLVPKLGWAVCFLFLMCGTLRLARYNVQSSGGDKRWFAGLPIPAAAGVPVTMVLTWSTWHPQQQGLTPDDSAMIWLMLVLMAVAAFLMISTFRYRALADLTVGRQWRLVASVSIVVLLAAIANWPAISLLVIALTYAASGPGLKLASLLGRRRGTEPESEAVETSGESS
jgi:CDP-diacylglycerol--serine O-phosphatidyltransferase